MKYLIMFLLLTSPVISGETCKIRHQSSTGRVDKMPYDVIRITTGKKAWSKIKAIREEAIKRDIHFRPANDFVKAKMTVGKDEYDIKMRLKGDLGDHWKADYKWSFRVNVRKGDKYRGMSKFALQRPKTRNWYWEWLTHTMAKMSNLATLKQGFVRLYVNGKDFGPYLIEQAFGEDVLTYNKVKYPNKTSIVKFKEDPHWAVWRRDGSTSNNNMAYYDLPIKSYNIGSLQRQENIREELRLYQSGFASAGETFNLKKMANYMALADLTGGFHGFHPINLRFVWQSFELEPIVCDTMSGYRISKLMIEREDEGHGIYAFIHPFFRDPKFVKAYRGELRKIGREYDMTNHALIDLIEYDIKPIEDFIGLIEGKQVLSVREVLIHNAKVIKKYLKRTNGQ